IPNLPLLLRTMSYPNGLVLQGKQPLFSFGVITDVQYADIPDGRSFLGVPRYYRNSILVLQKAIKSWNNHQNLRFSLNLGDIVDGFCPKDQSLEAVKKVVTEFDKFDGPVYHMIGNHCLYNLPRSKLLPLLTFPNADHRLSLIGTDRMASTEMKKPANETIEKAEKETDAVSSDTWRLVIAWISNKTLALRAFVVWPYAPLLHE
ncbi:hypothetical protein M8C21_018812, partial [Ambrosia artemisiifolia]